MEPQPTYYLYQGENREQFEHRSHLQMMRTMTNTGQLLSSNQAWVCQHTHVALHSVEFCEPVQHFTQRTCPFLSTSKHHHWTRSSLPAEDLGDNNYKPRDTSLTSPSQNTNNGNGRSHRSLQGVSSGGTEYVT